MASSSNIRADTMIPVLVGKLILDKFVVDERARPFINASPIQIVKFNIPLSALTTMKDVIVKLPKANKIKPTVTVIQNFSASSTDTYGKTGYSCHSYELPCLINAEYKTVKTEIEVTLEFASNLNKLQLIVAWTNFLQKAGFDVVIRRHLIVSSIMTKGIRFSVPILNSLPSDMARIRRIILEDIPTMAVGTITIYENKTVWPDSNVFQLISSLVFNSGTIVDEGVSYKIDVNGIQGKTITLTGRDLEAIGPVYDVVPVEYNVPIGQGKMMTLPQTILKLLPDHSLKAECKVIPGKQKNDARWGCVTNLAFIRRNDHYELKGAIRGNLTAKRIVDDLIKIINTSDDLRISINDK